MESLCFPKINDHDPSLKLKVENRLKNIFVTQIEEARDKEDKNINHIPIITEPAGSILETGVHTLQRTLVLRKQVEVDEVDACLRLKRQEFRSRLQALEIRRAELELQQQENKDRAVKFEKFVQDNEAKRRRALRKYQAARKQNEQKAKEWEDLKQQVLDLEASRQHLKKKVAKYKVYEDYLLKVLDLLPENYLEYGTDSLATPIIRRYETLSLTCRDLEENLGALMERLEQSQHKLEALKRDHDVSKLMTNRKLSELQTEWDKVKEKSKQLEMNLQMYQGQSRNWNEEMGSVLIAIRNLGKQCHLKHYGPIEDMDLSTMLDMIKEFMIDKSDMEKMAVCLADLSSGHTSAFGQPEARDGKLTPVKRAKKPAGNGAKI